MIKNDSYYKAFVNSILSLDPKVRNTILKAAYHVAPKNDSLLYLWNEYNDVDSGCGKFIHALLEVNNLAID